MAGSQGPGDEVLAHSEDEGEWEEQAEQIERRPSGTQVISARLPTAIAEALLAEAARRGVRPSELVRDAVDAYLHAAPGQVVDIVAFGGRNMRVSSVRFGSPTRNVNLVVEEEQSLSVVTA